VPYAGGAASVYRDWGTRLRATVEVWAVQYPGREDRLAEAPYGDLSALVSDLATAIEPRLGTPYAFFGHSMGALVAFEACRTLRERRCPAPEVLIVSGQSAPDTERRRSSIHHLDDAEFLCGLREFGGLPDAMLTEPELIELLLPTLRADMRACETYEFAPGAPLDSPIRALTGVDDGHVAVEDVFRWQQHTTASFHCRQFPGGHFFIHSAQSEVLPAVAAALSAR
jgi:medium-chain acyl-[acyl-carrier-protein] hydrolase